MRREIESIPDAIDGLLAADGEFAAAAEAIRRADPPVISIVARGSSDHAAVYARYLLETQLGIAVSLVAPAVTTVYAADMRGRGGVLLAISQSGEGHDVVAICESARRRGAVSIGITNDPSSALAQIADHVLLCRAGPEVAVPATKTYTLSLAVIVMLVARLTPRENLLQGLAALPDAVRGGLAIASKWVGGSNEQDGPVAEFAASDVALVASRGYNLATAFEIALKLKESAGIFAEGYAAPDLLHGPIVLAGVRVPMLVIRPDGPMGQLVDDAVEAAEQRGARPWLIGGEEVASRPRSLALQSILPEALTPILFALPGQLLAEAVALRRGKNPDLAGGMQKVTLSR